MKTWVPSLDYATRVCLSGAVVNCAVTWLALPVLIWWCASGRGTFEADVVPVLLPAVAVQLALLVGAAVAGTAADALEGRP